MIRAFNSARAPILECGDAPVAAFSDGLLHHDASTAQMGDKDVEDPAIGEQRLGLLGDKYLA